MSACENVWGQFNEFLSPNSSTVKSSFDYLILWFCGIVEAGCDYSVLLDATAQRSEEGLVSSSPLPPRSTRNPLEILVTYLLVPLVNDSSNCVLHRDADLSRLWLYVLGLFLCVAILVANLFQVASTLLLRKGRNSSSHLVVSLSLADCVNAVAFSLFIVPNVIAIAAAQDYDWKSLQAVDQFRNHFERCGVQFGLLFTSMLASILTLCCISTEKYVAIFYPFRYPFLVTRKTRMATVVLIWLVSLSAGQLAIYLTHQPGDQCTLQTVIPFEYRVVWALICVLVAILILVEYFRIYRVASDKYQHTERTRHSVADVSAEPAPSRSRRPSVGLMPRAVKNMKALKTVLILLVGFYLCWMPLLIFLFIPSSSASDEASREKEDRLYNRTLEYLMLVSCVNSLINPVVYGLRNRHVLDAVRNLCKTRDRHADKHESRFNSETDATQASSVL